MASSFNRKTVKALRDLGYPLVEVVERYSPHSKRTHDMFGLFDVFAVGHDTYTFIQVTSRSNAQARRTKLLEHVDILNSILNAGGVVELHLWDKLTSDELDRVRNQPAHVYTNDGDRHYGSSRRRVFWRLQRDALFVSMGGDLYFDEVGLDTIT